MGKTGFEINHSKFLVSLLGQQQQQQQQNLNKSNIIYLKSFSTARATLNERKRQHLNWEKWLHLIWNTCTPVSDLF